MPEADPQLVAESINAIRFLSIDAIQKANSGHPGAPLGLAPLAYTLFTRHVRHDPADPNWPDRDRFVLSNGHASMLLYSTLHLSGYDISIADLEQFRQYGSKTPGHPERHDTPGVEVTTGPLGQGFANAVGMAVAERMLAARFPESGIVDHRTWVICGDGDLMEGVDSEAASLAGLWGLGKLCVFWDDNHVTLSGPADMHFKENVAERFAAYGWQVLHVADVNDLDALDRAIAEAAADTQRPALVVTHSHIGYGSPVQDSFHAHGSPLGADGVAATREQLGWTYGPFEVPEAVYAHWRETVGARATARQRWEERFAALDPAEAAEFRRLVAGDLPDGWDADLPAFDADPKGDATRNTGGAAENFFGARVTELVGGSADLDPSTKTYLKGSGHFAAHPDGGDPTITQPRDWGARNIEFGVREHAMGSIANGIAAHGMLRPFTATFFVFSDYMRPPIRLAALMGLPVVFVFTHDSIGVGEDGPTHQPVEHLMALRAIPNLTVIRPADANEAYHAWKVALANTSGPTVLVLSRQNLPTLDPGHVNVEAGASVVHDGGDVVLVGTGSEVSLAVAARDLLAADGIAARVVSMPSFELFRAQPAEVRHAILPPGVPVVSVEAGVTFGWSEWADVSVGIDRFGASAPANVVYRELGLTSEAVAAAAKQLVQEG